MKPIPPYEEWAAQQRKFTDSSRTRYEELLEALKQHDNSGYIDKAYCEMCPLKDSKKVLGEGSRIIDTVTTKEVSVYGQRIDYVHTNIHDNLGNYDVVAVGIKVDRAEIDYNKVFAGKSGFMLRETLKQMEYGDHYLTNVIPCEIPDSATEADIRAATKCCTPRLEKEIADRNPKLVIALGNAPLQALVPLAPPITEIEGRVQDGYHHKVLPIQNPAAILHKSTSFQDFADYMEIGKNYLSGHYFYPTEPEVIIFTEDNKGEILQKLENADEYAFDIETTTRGFYPYGRDPDKVRCISISLTGNEAYIIPMDYVQDKDLINVINKSKLIMHNGQFDSAFLWQAGYRNSIYYDTLLAHYQMDERPMAHGLKALSHKYLGAPEWEADIKNYLPYKKSSYDFIPDDVLYKYASFDSAYTYLLYKFLKRDVPLDGNNFFSKLVMPCTNMLIDVRHKGVTIDITKLASSNELLQEDLDKIEKELLEMTEYPVNPLATQDVAHLLYDKMEIPTIGKFGRSTGKNVLALLPPSPIIDKILEARRVSKLKSTYVVSLIDFLDGDCKVHPFLKLFGTITGRLSSEDPSIMNIKRDSRIKEMYLPPDPGTFLLDLDQKQMELRVYAMLAQDLKLVEIFEQEGDPHGDTMQYLLDQTGISWERPKVKSGVFGELYGRGEESFQYGFHLSLQEAKDLKLAINKNFPKIGEYRTLIKNMIDTDGEVESLFGPKRRFPLLTWENKHEALRQGVNFSVQKPASDINLFCMLHLYENRRRLGVWPMFPVHDSNVMQIEDPATAPDIMQEVEEFSADLVGNKVKFKVEAKIGPNWGNTKEVVR